VPSGIEQFFDGAAGETASFRFRRAGGHLDSKVPSHFATSKKYPNRVR
jgi:hypothetical protein